MEILIRNTQSIPVNQKSLVETAKKLLQTEGCPDSCEVSVLLTDDTIITELNRKYLDKDRPTDVLSFYQAKEPEERTDLLGDVVISVETAKHQADERNKSLDDELDLLLAHGLLHLLGYTDYTKESAKRMQERAAEIIGAEAAR